MTPLPSLPREAIEDLTSPGSSQDDAIAWGRRLGLPPSVVQAMARRQAREAEFAIWAAKAYRKWTKRALAEKNPSVRKSLTRVALSLARIK